MLTSKIIHLKEMYKFCFDHFLIKFTVFVLNVKNVIKNQKFNLSDKLRHKKNVKEQNCSYFDRFLIGLIVFLINMKNAIK